MSPSPVPAAGTGNRDVAKGASAALASRLGAVIELVSQPLYVWMFGLAGYGVYAVLWSAVNLVENFADLGSTSALQRVVPQAGSRAGEAVALRAALLIGVLPCLLLAGLAVTSAPWLAMQMNVADADRAMLVDGIRLFAWSLPLWAFVEVATSALRARRVFGAEIRLRIFWEQFIRMGLALGFWLAGFGISGLLYAHLISLAITVLLSVRLLARQYDLAAVLRAPAAPGVFRETLLAGLATLPYNGAARLYGDAPPIIINLMIPGAGGAAAAALYTIARKISSIVQMIRVAFAYVIAPLASAAAAEGRRDQVVDIYGFSTRLSTVIALPLTAAIVAGAPAVLDLFGRDAIAAWGAVAILSVARALEAMGGQAAQIQQVLSRYHRPLVGSLTGLALATATGWVTVPLLGLTGVALAVGTGLATSALMNIWQVDRHEDMHPFGPIFATTLARALAVATLVALVATAAMLAPAGIRLALLLPVLLGGIWLSLRLALARADTEALGKAAGKLRLA